MRLTRYTLSMRTYVAAVMLKLRFHLRRVKTESFCYGQLVQLCPNVKDGSLESQASKEHLYHRQWAYSSQAGSRLEAVLIGLILQLWQIAV